MFRRSRFSIRPNVSTAGRTAATPQEAPSANQETSETPKDVGESSTAAAVTGNKPVVTPEKPAGSGDGSEQNGEGTSSSAAVQRRKRFAIKPKVAPGRPSSLARTPKSPVKAVSETPVEVRASDLDKPSTSGQTTTTAGLQSPRRRRPSEDSKQPKVQPKPTLLPSDSSGPSAVPPAEEPQEQTRLPADSSKQLEQTSGGQVKDVPSRLPDKVPQSLPDKEAIEISEKAKTLVSSKSGLSQSQPAFSLSRLLNDPSDIQRLEKARKLRELLRQEMHKEKKIKKAKARTKEFTLDPAKMTMRDLIRYLPVSNPMTSSLEDTATENETVVPPSPGREESPERAQEPEVPPKIASPRVEEEEEEEEEAAEEEQEEALMVPQVKVAEDGSLIIDEESLTVEVQRAKGPNTIQDRDPIFERGSTTTYSSFRKGTYSKPWSSEETDMFFLAISMVGTDFSMICQLFPHRARSEIKNKFKKEERENTWRIDKAFRERRKLDIEYFSKLLEKILEVQKNKKKLKSLAGKNSPRKQKRKAKGKKAAKKLSDVEEEDEEEESEIPDLEEEEEEGEKENEDLGNEGGTPVSKPKKKRKRKTKQDASTEEPNDKKNKTSEKSNEQDEAYIPEDTEAALPEDHTNSDKSEKTEDVTAAKDTAIKPAKLSRGRAPKPLLPLGRKWGKKPPPPSTKAKDAVSDKGDEIGIDGASKEQGDKDASPSRQADKNSANDDISSEEEEATVQPPRPTRYGRVPKPTKPLTYPAKDDAQSSSSETTPASPAETTASAAKPKAKCTAKRGRSSKSQSTQESKKPKLITLRASQSEYSDEENEKQYEEEEVEEEQHACSTSKDSTAPAFVPASLRSPHPVIPEVEETMEELDILANMPDVLGISKDALCHDASFELAQNETGTAEPCEHQLDLLVDVIDFLSSEHTEVSDDQSYNEAAQTLLTIGNLAHLSQSAQSDTSQIVIQDNTTVATSVNVDDTSHHLEVEIAPMPAAQEINSAAMMSATSGQGVRETPETVATVEQQNSLTDNGDMPNIETNDHTTGADMDPTPQLQSSPQRTNTSSPQTRRGRLSKVKPKPNLGHASRTAQSRSQPETSTVRTDRVSHSLSQPTETVAKETHTIADYSQKLSNDEISSAEVKLTEEPSGSQRMSVGLVKSGAAALDQSASENQSRCFSGTQFEPSLGQTIRESSSDNLVTSDSAVTEPQIGQETNTDSVLVQQSSDQPAPCITPDIPEDTAFDLKEESKDTSTCQIRRSRFQDVEPKPKQTSRTALSKPQTTKELIEKDLNLTTNLELNEKMMNVEAQPPCPTSSEKLGQSTCPPSSSHTPMEEVSTAKENETDVGVVGQVESGAATSDLSASENQDTGPTSESTEEKLMSRTTERTCSNPLTSDSVVQESQVGQRSNIDSAPVQESSNHPAPCVTPVEDLPASQKEDNRAASTPQTRKSRFQRVKPKPNLAQASRTVHAKPQITKDTMEKDSNLPPIPKLNETTVVEVEAQPSYTASPEKPSQSTVHTSGLLPSFDLGSTLTSVEEVSKTEKKKTDVGIFGQVEWVAATSDQSASENQNTRPTSESTEGTLMSKETAESSGTNPLASDPAVPESQVEQNMDSAPVQESRNHPAPSVTPAEDLSTSQTEESEVTSTCQTRKSRYQRVKPKPNLAQAWRAVHSKPQIIKDTIERDSSATASPKFSGSSLTPTDELSTSEEKTDVEIVSRVESDAATSDQRASENQNTRPTSESAEEKLMSTNPVTHMQLVEKPYSTTSRPESTDNIIPEVKAVPTCIATSPGKPVQIESTDTALFSVPSLELCSTLEPTGDLSSAESQKPNVGSGLDLCPEDSEKNEPQRKRRFPKVKPKPNLRSSTRITQTKLQSSDVSKPSEVHHVETSSDVTSQQKPVDSDAQTQPKPAEIDSKHLTKTDISLNTEPLSSTKSPSAASETIVKGTSSNDTLSATSSVTEHLSGLTDSILENENSEKFLAKGESTVDKAEVVPASQWDCKQDMSVEATETNAKPTDDPPAISNVKSSEDCSTKSRTPDPKESTQKPPLENDSEAPSQDSVQKCSETTQTAVQSNDDNGSESTDSSKSSRKAPQTRRGRLVKPKPNLGPRIQPSKSQQVQNIKQAEADSESVVPSVSHKPVSEDQPDIEKPVEGAIDQHSNQNKVPIDAGASLACLTQDIEQMNPHDSSQHVAATSLEFVTKPPDNTTQDASTSSTGGTQSQPSLTIFPDMLLDQVPSDPDEPFFILSLTEIPVSSSGEMMDSGSEPLPYLPVTDASVQQESSVPAEGLAAAGDGSLSNVAVSASMEEETGLVNVNRGSLMENPVDPHESTGVQSSVSPETTENNDETEHPPTKQRPRSTGRTAKLRVPPKIPRKKQASQTLTDKEAESIPTRVSELHEPSVQPTAFDEVVTEPQKGSGDNVNTEKESLTSGKDPEDSSSGATTTQRTRANIQKRKPKDFPSFLSETNSSAQSASKGPQVKTPRPAGRRSTPSPEASTSHDVAPTASPTPQETHSTPSTTSPTQAEVDLEQAPEHSRLCSDQTPNTSPRTAEVTASKHIDIVEDSSLEEEPTNVSQYFLSDIFTDVEEG